MDQNEYKAYNVRTHEGHWRQLTIRNNQAKDLLVIVIFDKQDLSEVL
jgi:tRNA (uracil-5-)-methyltransferase